MSFVNHALSVAIGVILGAGVVWWVRPDKPAGVVFLVVASILICFTLGVVGSLLSRLAVGHRSNGRGDGP